MSAIFVQSMDYNPQREWKQLGTITVANGALGATARTRAAVAALAAANYVEHRVPLGTVSYQWRFRTDGSENDAPVLHMYGAALEENLTLLHYSRIATLTLSQGTQLHSGSIYFCDTVTPTLESWFDVTSLVEPTTPDNHISSYALNTFGYAWFCFVASTLAVTTIYIDGRQLP